MKSVLGVLCGLILAVLAFGSWRVSFGGWGTGHDDIGFWWAVIASLLSVAAGAAVIGTIVHSRPQDA